MIANLNVRVGADNRVPLGTTQSGCIFKAASKGATEVGLEYFAVGIFYQAPSVVRVTIFSQVSVDGVLAKGDDSVDLLFGVGEA